MLLMFGSVLNISFSQKFEAITLNCLILREQVLPPCVWLRQADFPLHLIRVKQLASIQNMLCLSFGFGGQNGAIALGNL